MKKWLLWIGSIGTAATLSTAAVREVRSLLAEVRRFQADLKATNVKLEEKGQHVKAIQQYLLEE